jgi:hypothetical protein
MARLESVNSDYPQDAVPLNASSGNVANATATATLTAPAGKTAFIKGFVVSGAGATVGLPVSVTITNVLGGTQTYTYSAAVGALISNTPLTINFPYAIPATGIATNIVVSCPALGAGATNNTVVAFGYSR